MLILQLTAISVYVLITVIGTLAFTYSESNPFFRFVMKVLAKGDFIVSSGIVGLILSGLYLGSSMALRFSGVQTGVLSTIILILAAVLTGINLGQTCFGFMNLLEDDTHATEDPEEE